MVYNSRGKKLPCPWQTAFVMSPQNDACDVLEMANKATHEVNMSEQKQHVVTQQLPHTNHCTDQRRLSCLKVAKCKKNKKVSQKYPIKLHVPFTYIQYTLFFPREWYWNVG